MLSHGQSVINDSDTMLYFDTDIIEYNDDALQFRK